MARINALIDTNVLVRFLTGERDGKYGGLYDFFQSLERGDKRVELKLIVLFQTVFVLKGFYKVPKEEVAQSLLDLLGYKGIGMKEKKVVRRTVELWRDNKLDIVDCYLIACLEGNEQNCLYSYDRDFDRFKIPRREP
jgi:predicted nucleic-acid-binding protein